MRTVWLVGAALSARVALWATKAAKACLLGASAYEPPRHLEAVPDEYLMWDDYPPGGTTWEPEDIVGSLERDVAEANAQIPGDGSSWMPIDLRAVFESLDPDD